VVQRSVEGSEVRRAVCTGVRHDSRETDVQRIAKIRETLEDQIVATGRFDDVARLHVQRDVDEVAERQYLYADALLYVVVHREPGPIFTPVQFHHLLRLFDNGHERFDLRSHFPILRLPGALVTAGLSRWNMLVPVPNQFFLSMRQLFRDLLRCKYELFLDVKPW
jgi:hypothetical protein